MSRVFLLVVVIVATAGAALAYGDPKQISKAGNLVTEILRKQSPPPLRLVDVPRGNTGEFGLQAKINHSYSQPIALKRSARARAITARTASLA